MWINEYLDWQSHITKRILKLTINLNVLKYSQKLMPTNTKKLFYHAHIGSHLQYGMLPWGNGATNEQLNKLQKIQNQCLNYITGKRIKSTSANNELNILTVRDVVELANQKFGYKLLHNLLPKRVSKPVIWTANCRA